MIEFLTSLVVHSNNPGMKKLFSSCLFLFVPLLVHGQITETFGDLLYADTLEFSPLHEWITIENPESNIWEVGSPNKLFFDEALSGSRVMLTDSSMNYPGSRNDYFYITIPLYDSPWGEGILSFYHKFDTDTLTDGGIIEMSYDNGITWSNVKDDITYESKEFVGLYEATLEGGECGYSGRSDDWKYVELYWLWRVLTKSSESQDDGPMIRFRFISDDIDTQKEGWMIDDIVFRGYSVTGDIEGYLMNKVTVFPNPADDIVNFRINELCGEEVMIRFYNAIGQSIKSVKTSNYQLDISDLQHGVYFYEIQYDSEVIFRAKLIKK